MHNDGFAPIAVIAPFDRRRPVKTSQFARIAYLLLLVEHAGDLLY